MPRFHVTIDIQAPPDTVWRVMSDVERWPDTTPSVSSVTLLTPGPLAVGSRARVKQPKLLPAEWTVTELRPGAGFTWTTRSAGVASTGLHYLEPTPTGSRVTLTLLLDGMLAPMVARLAGGLIRRYIALEAQGLKREAERQARG